MKVVPEGTVNDGKISAFCENKVTAQRKKNVWFHTTDCFDFIQKKPDTLILDNIQLILWY